MRNQPSPDTTVPAALSQVHAMVQARDQAVGKEPWCAGEVRRKMRTCQ
jgi:hypothetical protein